MASLREKTWLPKKLPKAVFWVTSAKMGNLFFLRHKKALPFLCFNPLGIGGTGGRASFSADRRHVAVDSSENFRILFAVV